MPAEPKMTKPEAKQKLRKWTIIVCLLLLVPIMLLIYGLAHPVQHRLLMLVLGMMIVPTLLAVYVNKSGRAGFLTSETEIQVTNIRSLVLKHPGIVFTVPLLLFGIPWCIFLVSMWVKSQDGHKAWLKERPVTVLCWIQVPILALAYLCVRQHAAPVAIYIACCIVYSTVSVAIYGLQLEGGVVKFFGSYKAQASPLIIIIQAFFCCLAFGFLHYAVWMRWPTEYSNFNGFEDAIYFSVVTMATVGYGDILPVGHLARWLCVAEILSGVLLLVVGVSASMTVWLQTNQPTANGSETGELKPPPKDLSWGK